MESYSLGIKSPKEEEEEEEEEDVASSTINSIEFSGSRLQSCPFKETDIIEYLEGILGINDDEDEEEAAAAAAEEDEESKGVEIKIGPSINYLKDRQLCLKLNLNYEEVIDAWSDRRPLLAHSSSTTSAPTNRFYREEILALEEERARREASVLRYKEKRRNRLFSKKIRYEVRKLNADKRPRLKGRFVKRVREEGVL